MVAIKAAVDDINFNSSILRGTTLAVAMQDSNYSGFLGIVEGKTGLTSYFQFHT